MKGKHVVIPIFVPHKGCPFDCIYCNQKNISGQKEEMTEEKMRSIIEAHIESTRKDSFMEIGFYGGSFTGIEKEDQLKLLNIANEYIEGGWVRGIRLSTRPDYISESILEYLKSCNVSTIELGVQSLDNEVLAKSCRGHTAESVYKACKLIKSMGFILGIQTMIGLPGDNYEKSLNTARKVVELLPDIVRIYPTLVIKSTYLEDMYKRGNYEPLDMECAVSMCAELLEIYSKDNINVIRVGLQPTENIKEGADIVAGPFHPAFRQLAESRLARNIVERIIDEKGLYKKSEIVICADAKKISDVVGQKRQNITYLKQKYNFSRVIVKCYDEYEICDVKY